jgi:hypothetical protein
MGNASRARPRIGGSTAADMKTTNAGPRTPAGYSGTPLWKKLGYKEGMAAYVGGAPGHYRGLLALPSHIKVTWLAAPKAGTAFAHVFATSRSRMAATLRSLRRKLAPTGMIWVSWPKRSSGVSTDITEDTIRDVALPMGLVDVKVCAVDAVWSGLKLMIRKELR